MKKLFLLLVPAIFFSSCEKEKGNPEFGGFPEDVGRIVYTSCAVPGCHNDKSKDAAAGLSLETWEKAFEGGTGNAVIIPYQSKYSTFFSFVNIHPDFGPVNTPTMPYGKAPLTREHITSIKNWIEAGAPNREGFVKFSDNPLRKKYYVTNQGCDVVTVVDAETNLIMRYIDVGINSGIESAHMVKVSPDGQYWYVIFSVSGTIMQKYRTSDDSYVGQITLPAGQWNTFTITPDSKEAFIVNFQGNGSVAHVDLENLSMILHWAGSNLFENPHGSALSNFSDSVYVTAQAGNFIYKVSPDDPSSPRQVSLIPGQAPSTSYSINPHEIMFSPDGKKYAVTCQGTNEVRILQSSNDSLLAVIPVGTFPSELYFSESTDYLFVTCQEDISAPSGNKGSIAVINYKTNTLVKKLNTGFFQPHGIVVDDDNKLVYITNRNIDSGGPAPHHSSGCDGKNGYINFIDLNTLTVIPNKKIEVVTDPYSVTLRK